MTDIIPRIPVFRTTASSYRLTFQNFATLTVLALPWLLTLAVASAGLYWLLHPVMAAVRSNTAQYDVIALTTYALSALIGSAIAVPWHRVLLLDEDRGAARANAPPLRILRYFAVGFLLIVPLTLLSIASTFIPDGDAAAEFLPGPWAIVSFVFFALLFIYARLGLKLPAVALGEDHLSFGEIWRATRGNSWRLFAIMMMTTIPALALFAIVVAAFDPELSESARNLSRTDYVMSNTIAEVASTAFGMIAITSLSLSFRHFFPAESAAADLTR